MRPLAAFPLLLVSTALLLPGGAAADPLLALSAGAYDVGDFEAGTAEAGVEIQLAPVWTGRLPRRLALRPMLGLSGTGDGAVWGYAGLHADFEASPTWMVSPAFAVSLFDEGDGKDLGGPVEFRSAIEISYRFATAKRLGLTFHHLSNGGLYDDNPGTNSLLLTWTVDLGRRSPRPLPVLRSLRQEGRGHGR